MYGEITYTEIENGSLKGSIVYVDVRTRKEYLESTIPGSVNIPIMNDEERIEIGTEYVQGDIKEAKRMGIKVGSEKLPDIYRQIEELYESYDNVVIFCARGGFRSRSVFYMMRSMAFNVYQLKGGYKSYRQYINEHLPQLVESVNYIVLHGNTGSGKTKILKELEKNGYNTLDLEGFANHRGSLLGSIGLGEQNTQKMFESLIYHKLRGKEGEIFFTEGESKRIGRVLMQNYMYDKLQNSKIVLVESPMEYRKKVIIEDYVDNNDDEIIKSLDLLSGLISKENIESMKSRIINHEYESVSEDLMVKYYDIHYKIPKRYDYKLYNDDEKKSAEELVKVFL